MQWMIKIKATGNIYQVATGQVPPPGPVFEDLQGIALQLLANHLGEDLLVNDVFMMSVKDLYPGTVEQVLWVDPYPSQKEPPQ